MRGAHSGGDEVREKLGRVYADVAQLLAGAASAHPEVAPPPDQPAEPAAEAAVEAGGPPPVEAAGEVEAKVEAKNDAASSHRSETR